MRIIYILTLVVLVAGLVTPVSANRQFGIQGGYGFDLDWFIGARAELETAKLFKNSRSAVDFNWYFPGGSFKYFDFIVNYLWPLMTVMPSYSTAARSKLSMSCGNITGIRLTH